MHVKFVCSQVWNSHIFIVITTQKGKWKKKIQLNELPWRLSSGVLHVSFIVKVSFLHKFFFLFFSWKQWQVAHLKNCSKRSGVSKIWADFAYFFNMLILYIEIQIPDMTIMKKNIYVYCFGEVKRCKIEH